MERAIPRTLLLIGALATLGACAPHLSSVTLQPGTRGPIQAEQVQVFADEKEIPEGYEELGLLLVNSHVALPANILFDTLIAVRVQRLPEGDQRQAPVFRELLRRAAQIGANGVLIKTFAKGSDTLSVAGVALRLPPKS